MTQRHTLVALVQDHPGVLTRAVSVFRRRGLNITSLHVAPTERAGFSELTCVVEADRIDDAKRSLSKLIEVVEVKEVHDSQADGVQ